MHNKKQTECRCVFRLFVFSPIVVFLISFFCLKYMAFAVILLFAFWGYFLQKCSSLYAAYTESLGSDKVL